MTPHRTEPSLNPRLADALAACHPQSLLRVQETGLLAGSNRQPDIVVETPGRVRCLVENKYDTAAGRAALEKQCEGHLGTRWQDGKPVEAIVGVLSPEVLGVCPEREVATLISTETFRYAAWLPNGLVGSVRFPADGWLHGGVRDLAAFVDRLGADAIDTTELGKTVRAALAAGAVKIGQDPLAPSVFSDLLDQLPGEQTYRMAMAVLFNAVLFQTTIAAHHPQIPSPTRMLRERVTQIDVLDAWRDILEINYWPIFGISRRLLVNLNSEILAYEILSLLYMHASRLASEIDAQGLVGRVFGELIGDRKFLAAFYTEPASAALLAELAISRLKVDWANLEEAGDAHVGDLACGTGALLTAAYRRIAEKHRLTGGDDRDLHRRLIEDSLVGCDILAAAVHLTAARLSGEQPAIDYTGTRTWVMPYGDAAQPDGTTQVKLGSLDLLGENEQWALWGDGSIEVAAAGESHHAVAAVPDESLDVVIMNPPFTRSTTHESVTGHVPQPAFAGLGTTLSTQRAMPRLLEKRVRGLGHRPAYSGQVGLGSAFIDLAHTKLRTGGVLALILPAAVISGPAWKPSRHLIEQHYKDVMILTISASDKAEDTTSRAFSADTGMAEAMVIATKRSECSTPESTTSAHYVTLNRRPTTSMEALEIAAAIDRGCSDDQIGKSRLALGDSQIGWLGRSSFAADMLGNPAGVASPDVTTVADGLLKGQLRLPRHPVIPLHGCPLSEVGASWRLSPGHSWPYVGDAQRPIRHRVP